MANPKPLGGIPIILLAILSGGRLWVLLMLLFTIIFLICWPRKKQAKLNAKNR